ncbi:MAG: DUF2188 domain-containing protein [Treponema sp.]|nr:DUF2188 domain-containing protein [Treponema sp.]MBR0030889.1 DUF2188 domain-containing protein [Treponema sp.]
MPNPNNRTVYPTENGWANKKNGASRPEKIYATQAEAIEVAKEQIKHAGGADLTIMNRENQIRRKITVAPGNDPCPPIDRT